MDYNYLANELFDAMIKFPKLPFQEATRNCMQGEKAILRCLYSNKDGATSGEISNEVHLSTGRIAIALNSLEKKKWIERKEDEQDKRKVRVYITYLGKEHVQEKIREGISQLENTLRKLGNEDAQDFVRIMKKIIKISKEME